MAGFWHTLWASPVVLAYLAGCLTGWRAARRATHYMLGGRL